jgi:alpha-ketoglutarate-dependent taurine dioxygenase
MNILENNKTNYKLWADKKLQGFSNKLDDLIVEIDNPNSLSKSEKAMMHRIINQHNIVFFQINKGVDDVKSSIKMLASQVGLGNYEIDSKSDSDGLTEIKIHDNIKTDAEYIPYTNRQLKWHTDGYYNDDDNLILTWLLFCKNQSENGGLNKYMDHEIAYILFNENFDNIDDLMLNNAYRIPKNELNGREAIDNPIFSFVENKLHMKFSMREKNIIWNDKSKEASKNLKNIINDSDMYHISHKFTEGQGVITNNIIHMRTSFTNLEKKNRLLYRLRSKQRMRA